MKDIIKIVKSLESSSLLPKRVSKTIKNEAKQQRGWFLSILKGTLGASLLGNILTDKGAIAKRQGWGINRAKKFVRDGCGNKRSKKNKTKKTKLWKQNGLLVPPQPVTNFSVQKCSENEPRFNRVYFRDNLQKINDGHIWWILMRVLIFELTALLCMQSIMMLLLLILLN